MRSPIARILLRLGDGRPPSGAMESLNERLKVKSPTVLELFAGIGGVASAWPESEVRLALDISRPAQAVYERNFASEYRICALESIKADQLATVEADVWWMSPPCQPFTRKGNLRDWTDHRTAALRNLLALLPQIRPDWLVLENVVGFETSTTFDKLNDSLKTAGYQVAVCTLCPTEMGWPNRRPRVYVLAGREHAVDFSLLRPHYSLSLRDVVDDFDGNPETEAHLEISEEVVRKFASGMHRVKLGGQSVTACFGASYGKALMRAGSFLSVEGRLRRFSPREVARLLGFPAAFRLQAPEEAGELQRQYRRQWKLLGNSLSLPAVRFILSHIHHFDPRYEPIDAALPWLTS